MDFNDFVQAAKNFKFNLEVEKKDEQSRSEFVKRWPLKNLESMKIEEYHSISSKDNFIYWLEFKDLLSGVGGGNASKFGIYQSKSGEYIKGASGNKVVLKGEKLDSEFKKLKSQILEIIEFGRLGQIEQIEKIDCPMWDMILLKLIIIYYPEKYLTVLSNVVLKAAAKTLQIMSPKILDEQKCISLNFKLNTKLNELSETKDWSGSKRGTFIWELYKDLVFTKKFKRSHQMVLVGFYLSQYGEKHKDVRFSGLSWSEIYDSFYKSLGKDRDLENFRNSIKGTRDAFDAHLDSGRRGWRDEKGNPAKLGGEELKIFEKYKKLSENELWKLISKYTNLGQKNSTKSHIHENTEESSPVTKLSGPENIILYGPPGTGKTFKLKKKYLLQDQGLPQEINFDETLLEQPWYVLIALVIDHFGDKAAVSQILNHELIKKKAIFQKRDKNIVNTIWGTLQLHAIADSRTVKYDKRSGELIFDKNNDSSWRLPDGLPDSLKGFKVLFHKKSHSKTKPLFKFVTFHQSFGYEEFVEGIKPLDESHPLNEKGEVLTYKTIDGVFKQACLEALQSVGFIGTIDSFCTLEPNERRDILMGAPIYNFCIDEINRGNCAKVFGELITLIEPDKRLGCENEIILKLPYSNENFGVPSNIRIIGTMNTADRSVESLDSALRRRFSFEEVLPDPDQLSVVGSVDLSAILKTINERLEVLSDKDRAIGHSYLLNVKSFKDLQKAFKDKIIPLLNEYFFGDLEKVGLILGPRFVKSKRKSFEILAAFDSETREDYGNKRIFEISNIESMTPEDFESIYKNVT